jgi:hypothetical protein
MQMVSSSTSTPGGRPAAQFPELAAERLAPAQRWITGLSLVVSLLAGIAAAAGIVTANDQHRQSFVSLRGEAVTLQGGGLYAHESVSGAAQALGQDVVTLLVGIPLLLIATYLAARGSLRGRLLRAGALWYFAYTYLLMAFGGAYNSLFLVYVTLYSASLFACILSLLALDVASLRAQCAAHFARRTIAWLILSFGALLALLWLGRLLPALLAGVPPAGLESYSTLFVQAGDLGLVVPLAILTGVLLLRNHPVGYLLAGMLLVKGTTFGLALGAMMLAMAAAGVAVAPVEAVFFITLTLLCAAGTIHLLRNLPAGPQIVANRQPAGTTPGHRFTSTA